MADVYCHKVRLGVVLIQDDRILLVRQNNRDFWVFPGGTLEPDEGLAECAVREMREETALEVAIDRLLYVADFLRPGPGGSVRHTVDVFMLARYVSGEPVMEITENINEMGFFSLEEFSRMPVQPALAAERLRRDWAGQFSGVAGLYLGKYGPDGPAM